MRHALRRLRWEDITPILCYHAVGPHVASPLLFGRFHRISQDVFAAQIETLRSEFAIVPIDELAERGRRGLSVKGLSSVTFDDAYLSVLTHGVPVLEDLGAPATFFLTTSMVQGRIMWRDKIRAIMRNELVPEFLQWATPGCSAFGRIRPETFYRATKDPTFLSSREVDLALDDFLSAKGIRLENAADGVYCRPEDLTELTTNLIRFGNHTHSHYVLSSMTQEEQRRDIEAAECLIDEWKLSRSRVLAAPFGGSGDVDDRTRIVTTELGFRALAMAGRRIEDAFSGASTSSYEARELHRFLPVERAWFWAGA